MKKSYILGLSLLISSGIFSNVDLKKSYNISDGIVTVNVGDSVRFFVEENEDVKTFNWLLPPGLKVISDNSNSSLDAFVSFISKNGEISVSRTFNDNITDTVSSEFNVCRPISNVNDITINLGDSILISGEYRKDADIYYELTEESDNCEAITAHRLTVIPGNYEFSKPYLQTVTDSSIWISWKTNYEGESIVYYGENDLSSTMSGSYESLSSKYFWHSVELTGLKADTKYQYKVKTGNNESEIYSFKTVPNIGSNKKMRILLMGDHQIKSRSGYEWLMQAAKRKIEEKYGNVEDNISLIMNVGDQVDIGTLDQYEQIHLYKSSLLSPTLPIMTCVGNHETYSDSKLEKYAAHFHYENLEYKGIKSETENYYAYQVGRILFVVLSTEHTGSVQKQWVRKIVDAVKSDDNVDFMVSVNHRPIQAEQYIGDISSWVRNEIVPILSETKKHVLNFGGHHHLYHRGQLADYPLYHIINGGASWDQLWGMSSEEDYNDVQKTIDYWGYQILEFDDNEMKAECYTIGNKHIVTNNILIDSFSRKLNESSPSKPMIKDISEIIVQPATIEGSEYDTDHKYPLNSVRYQISSTNDFGTLVLDDIKDIENLYGSTGNPLHIPVDLNEYKDVTSLNLTHNQLKNGNYYIRLSYRDTNMEWSEWSETKSFSVEGSIAGDPEISLESTSFRKGETITISYKFAPENQNAWIGVYRKDHKFPANTSTKWTYTSGSTGEFKFTLSTVDEYYAILFKDSGYTPITGKLSFYNGPLPEYSTDKTHYNENDTVKVKFANVPKLASDWLGIYKTGTTPGGSGVYSDSWAYISNAANDSTMYLSTGVSNADKLTKGYYFLSYFIKGGYFEPAERVYFSVGDLISKLETEKTNFAPHEDILIYYTDGPGTPKDWVGMYQVGKDIDVDELDGFYYTYGETNGYITIPAGELSAADYFSALYINDSYEEVSPRIYLSIGKAPEVEQSFEDNKFILTFTDMPTWGDSINTVIIGDEIIEKDDISILPGRIVIDKYVKDKNGTPVKVKANGWQDNDFSVKSALALKDNITNKFVYDINDASFTYTVADGTNSKCDIVDMSGAIIDRVTFTAGVNKYRMNDFMPGIYIIRVTENDVNNTFRVIKN